MFQLRDLLRSAALVAGLSALGVRAEPVELPSSELRAAAPARDATVSSTSGAPVKLSSLRGKPAVLFYEDRNSTQLNLEFKQELFTRGKAAGLLDQVAVVAIANVKGFDWFPARNFVVSAVKRTEREVGIPVYLDWSGALWAEPWSLPADAPSVLVLSASGEVRLQLRGRLSDPQRAAVYAAIGDELGAAVVLPRGG